VGGDRRSVCGEMACGIGYDRLEGRGMRGVSFAAHMELDGGVCCAYGVGGIGWQVWDTSVGCGEVPDRCSLALHGVADLTLVVVMRLAVVYVHMLSPPWGGN